MLTTSDDGTARLRDRDGEPLATLQGETEGIFVSQCSRVRSPGGFGNTRFHPDQAWWFPQGLKVQLAAV
jgi:hypothetical protein